MSQEEINRLVSDVMGNPMMMAEAMGIKDQDALETYITEKGYDLTKSEMGEVWAMAAKIMSGHDKSTSETEALINEVKSGS